MSLDIDTLEHGRLHVFALSSQLAARIQEADDTASALEGAFGLPLNPDFVDLLEIEALGGLPLPDYIHQGYAIPRDAMDTGLLTGLSGHAALIMSRAFGGQAGQIETGPDLRHITTLTDPATAPPGPMPSTTSAQGVLDGTPAKKPVSQAAMSGRIATLALLVLFALVVVMIVVAG